MLASRRTWAAIAMGLAFLAALAAPPEIAALPRLDDFLSQQQDPPARPPLAPAPSQDPLPSDPDPRPQPSPREGWADRTAPDEALLDVRDRAPSAALVAFAVAAFAAVVALLLTLERRSRGPQVTTGPTG